MIDIKVGSVEVQLIKDHDGVVRDYLRDGFEPETRAAWSQIVVPGRAALDVGAYTGLYAIAAALLGAHSVAVEPVSVNFDRLLQNVNLNGVIVDAIRVGASDVDGSAKFWGNRIPLPSGGKIGQTQGKVVVGEANLIRLDCLDLDVAAIKIDVEGHEVEVINGLQVTLEVCRPKIIVEVLDADHRAALERALPDYRVDAVLDGRNLMMVAGG